MHVTVSGHTGLIACPGEGISNVLKPSWCCVLGPRLPLGRALERLTIGLGTTSRVGEIKPSSKVESVVIFHYLPTRSVTTLATRVKQDPKKSARGKVREKHGRQRLNSK